MHVLLLERLRKLCNHTRRKAHTSLFAGSSRSLMTPLWSAAAKAAFVGAKTMNGPCASKPEDC